MRQSPRTRKLPPEPPAFFADRGCPSSNLWYGRRLLLGQVHTPLRRFLPFAALALLAPAAGGAESSAGLGRTITVSATGYSLGGKTASGLRAGWGTVAVDPAVIPLGSHLTIPGYGKALAADTGGSVVGAKVDLWFPTVARAHAWGRRTVAILVR